jgi:lipopolysaccharide export system permease protein
MKIITRYLLREFLQPLGFILVVFVGLFIVAQLVDEMRGYVEHHPQLIFVVMYFLYRIPFYAVQVMPLAVLLAALLSLGRLARSNELIALKACGVGFREVAFPILAAALGISLLVLGFDELVLPVTNPRADYIKQVQIERKTEQGALYRRDRVTRSTSGNRILFMRRLDALAGRIEGVIYLELEPPLGVGRRLDAPRAHWSGGAWTFEDGVERNFDAAGDLVRYRTFASLAIPFKESPMDFVREEKDDTELLSMTVRDLRYRIRLLRELGSDPSPEEVSLHLKFAFPFASFILALLGVALPFRFPSGQRAMVGAAIGFVITLVTGFFFIGFIAIGTSLGNNGTLPPMLSVWMANLLFGAFGILMIFKART